MSNRHSNSSYPKLAPVHLLSKSGHSIQLPEVPTPHLSISYLRVGKSSPSHFPTVSNPPISLHPRECSSVSCQSIFHTKYQRGWPEQQTFTSHTFGHWKVQDQGTSRFGSWWRPASWLARGHLLLWAGRVCSGISSPCYGGTNPIMTTPS